MTNKPIKTKSKTKLNWKKIFTSLGIVMIVLCLAGGSFFAWTIYKETEDFFERIAVPLKTTETDLTKSEIKNRFKGSVIDFSEKDETIFKELYCDTTVNSWISDKSNVTRYEIIYLKKFLSENNEKSPESQRSNQKYFKRLNRLLRENPDFKEKFENDEEFANKIVSEAKTFGKNKLVKII